MDYATIQDQNAVVSRSISSVTEFLILAKNRHPVIISSPVTALANKPIIKVARNILKTILYHPEQAIC
jgi:hypothetical protein